MSGMVSKSLVYDNMLIPSSHSTQSYTRKREELSLKTSQRLRSAWNRNGWWLWILIVYDTPQTQKTWWFAVTIILSSRFSQEKPCKKTVGGRIVNTSVNKPFLWEKVNAAAYLIRNVAFVISKTANLPVSRGLLSKSQQCQFGEGGGHFDTQVFQ